MSIDFRVGKRGRDWVAIWYEAGKRHRFRLDATTQADARAALRAFIGDRERLLRSNRLTVEGLWSDYVTERAAQGKVSARRMRDAWKRLGPAFGSMYYADVSGDHVREYTADRRKTVSDGTIHTELGYLRAALCFAAKRGVIDRAPHIQSPDPSSDLFHQTKREG